MPTLDQIFVEQNHLLINQKRMTMIDVHSHFCGYGRLNGPKSKMKHPSDMPMPDSNSGGSDMLSNALPTRP